MIASATALQTLTQGSLLIDPDQHVASFAGAPLKLTAIELGILCAFLTRPTSVFNREQLMRAAYQLNIQVSDRTIDSRIRNIRAKLAALSCDNVIEKALIVLSHLADNAMRHKAQTIRLEAADERTTLRLTVSNDGEPISAPNRDRIFDAFFTTRRDQGSTGMGLAIARAVMASHGGSIRLKPTDGGAAFELQLPLA